MRLVLCLEGIFLQLEWILLVRRFVSTLDLNHLCTNLACKYCKNEVVHSVKICNMHTSSSFIKVL
jgi:hypothetical protein